jgi:hypothetical protein
MGFVSSWTVALTAVASSVLLTAVQKYLIFLTPSVPLSFNCEYFAYFSFSTI